MSNVINISNKIEEKRETEAFLDIIDNDIQSNENIEMIGEDIFSRIAMIEAAAQEAQEKRDLIEG